MSVNQDIEPSFRPDRYRWLKSCAALDLAELDTEVGQISSLLQACGECAAIAEELRDLAKDEFERARALIANNLRRTPGTKYSESAIDKLIPVDPDYETKLKELSQARLDHNLWKNLMSSLQAKSYSIGHAAGMINSGYITKDYIVDKRRREINAKREAVS